VFPLRDSHPARKFPLATLIIIGINVAVFLMELAVLEPDAFIYRYALVPAKIDWGNLFSLYPFITSQFLHAGFVHIIANMWFLKIFGDNVEERFGSTRFLAVYLLSGVIGGLAQYIFSPTSGVPMFGASGAVAGVLGAYLVFFPGHRVETLIPIGIFMRVVKIPASLMLAYWFLIQLFSGVGAVAVAQVGGVAWWAHIGGFVAGWLAGKIEPLFRFQTKKRKPAKPGFPF
jgi:membrane associated rhomboid family serine protease